MESRKKMFWLFVFVWGILFCISCKTEVYDDIQKLDRTPNIEPYYLGVTIPPNIAPMNFIIKEDGSFFKIIASASSNEFQISITSSNGVIKFPEKSWRKLINSNSGSKIEIQVYSSKKDEKTLREYKPIYINVSKEPIDPFLVYRLIHPGYYNWSDIKIVQRSLESFSEESIIENQLLEKNCVNCHSFNQNNSDNFLIHIRGSKGGTYFVDDDKITRTALKTVNMTGGATYPSWHPNGRYVAFSSNHVRQNFYAHAKKSIEVYDQSSSLILYDREKNEIINISEYDTIQYMQTFPSWSPDGKYLYFCRAKQNEKELNLNLNDIKYIKYNLVRRSFDAKSRTFGKTEIVFNAFERDKSVSFPKISPDGRFLVFTLCDYGTFPIWHQEADLYLLNLQSGELKKMNLNSNKTESYHTWSSNSKWLVFSSKRIDGRSARPYFAYINSWDEIGKPFVLPQEDPGLYSRMLKSFNIPEFVNGKIKVNPRDFASAAKQNPMQAKSGDTVETPANWIDNKAYKEHSEIERGIHE